jgi:hypothetical protein
VDTENDWHWTQSTAEAVYQITKAIQVRAAGLCAAAVIGLLACAGDIDIGTDQNEPLPAQELKVYELTVGYTGGCIMHFQDYLRDCQTFLDEIVALVVPQSNRPRVLLRACHDGGVIGAGVLAGVVGGTY